jgi:hypothetical protein
MLRRRSNRLAIVAAAIVAAVIAMFAAPTAAAPPHSAVPLAATPSAVGVLPDTSATISHPGSPDMALAAVPHIPAAVPGPAHQAAAAAPAIVPPWLSDQICSYNGVQLAGLSSGCTSATLGTYDPLDNCFWKKLMPQPPAGDPLWQGQSSAAPAALYSVTCMTHFGTNVGNAAATVVYSTSPPLNYGQNLTGLEPTVLAFVLSIFTTVLAISPVPAVGTEPDTNAGVFGLPNWLWLDIPPLFWNQKTFSKKIFLIGTISVSFQGQQVDWDMGDGHHVICATPGSAYHTTASGTAYKTYNGPPGPSPDCGYSYPQVGSFPISATATWFMSFKIGSTTGTFVLSRTTPATMMSIGELQVVTE